MKTSTFKPSHLPRAVCKQPCCIPAHGHSVATGRDGDVLAVPPYTTHSRHPPAIHTTHWYIHAFLVDVPTVDRLIDPSSTAGLVGFWNLLEEILRIE